MKKRAGFLAVLTFCLIGQNSASAIESGAFFRQQLPGTVFLTGPKFEPAQISIEELYQRRPGTNFVIPLQITGGDPSVRPSLKNAPVGLEVVNGGTGIAATSATLKGTFDIEIVKGEVSKATRIQIQDIAASISASTSAEANAVIRIEPVAAGVFGEPSWSWATKPSNWPANLELDPRTGVISGSVALGINIVGGQLRLQNTGDAASAVTSPFGISVNGLSCQAPWNSNIKHGATFNFYTNPAPEYWETCTNYYVISSCSNGVIARATPPIYQTCTLKTESSYAAGAPQRLVQSKRAVDEVVAAMRAVIANNWQTCKENSWCILEPTITSRKLLSNMFTVQSGAMFFKPDPDASIEWYIQSTNRWSKDSMMFLMAGVRKSDCLQLLNNLPAGTTHVAYSGSNAVDVKTLTTEALRNSICTPSSPTATTMQFNLKP